MPKFLINIKDEVKTTKEINIEFPLYLVYDGADNSDNCEVFYKVHKVYEDMTVLTLSKFKTYTSNAEYEIERHKINNFDEFSIYFKNNYEYINTNDSSVFDEILSEIK